MQGIFQCYGSALSCARAHGMRGIADKDHAIMVPRREMLDLIDIRFDDAMGVIQKRPDRVMPSPMPVQQLLTHLLIRNCCQLCARQLFVVGKVAPPHPSLFMLSDVAITELAWIAESKVQAPSVCRACGHSHRRRHKTPDTQHSKIRCAWSTWKNDLPHARMHAVGA